MPLPRADQEIQRLERTSISTGRVAFDWQHGVFISAEDAEECADVIEMALQHIGDSHVKLREKVNDLLLFFRA